MGTQLIVTLCGLAVLALIALYMGIRDHRRSQRRLREIQEYERKHGPIPRTPSDSNYGDSGWGAMG